MRAARDQSKIAYDSLQLCTGLEAGIEGATHDMAQRRREWTVTVTEGRAGEESADGGRTAADNAEREGGAAELGGVGEVPLTPGGWQSL